MTTPAILIYESYVLQNVKSVSFNPASLFELLLLLSGDTEVCPGSTPREIPELDTLLKAKGLHIFIQTGRGLLSNEEYLVELIDSFKKVQSFTLTETHLNKDLDYGTSFEIPGFDFVSKTRPNGSCGGGGVGIYIQNHLIWKRRSDLERDEIDAIVVEIMPEKAKSF